MQDRCAVEQDGLFRPSWQRLESGASIDADVQCLRAVVEWQVQRIVAAPRCQTISKDRFYLLATGLRSADPAHNSVRILAVQIKDGVRRRRHVSHGDRRVQQVVAGTDLLLVRGEVQAKAGRCVRQIPHHIANKRLCACRQPIVAPCRILPTFAFDLPGGSVVPGEFC